MNAENSELLKEFTAEQVANLDAIIARHRGNREG
jgi:hypothetical protein